MKSKVTAGILASLLIAGALTTGIAATDTPERNLITGSLYNIALKQLEARRAEIRKMHLAIDTALARIVAAKDENGKKPATVGDYLTLCQEDFDVIAAYGRDALPYLKETAKKSSGTLTDLLAKAAEYRIDPTLFDLTLTSPDGRYTFTAYTSLTGMTGKIWKKNTDIGYLSIGITDNDTGKEIISVSDFDGRTVEAVWSPDSRYLAMTFGDMKFFSNVKLFDTKTKGQLGLPYMDVFEYVRDAGYDLDKCCFLESFGAFEEDGTIRIDFDIKAANSIPTDYITGHFYYDPDIRQAGDPVFEMVAEKDID